MKTSGCATNDLARDAISLGGFKRDLRLHDHAALSAAAACDSAAGLFVIEPEWLASAARRWRSPI